MKIYKLLIPILFLGLLITSCKNSTPTPQKTESFNKAKQKIESTDFIFEHQVRLPQIKMGKKPPLLLLLHGLGSSDEKIFSFSKSLDSRLIVVAPRAPITIKKGSKYSWYPLDMKEGKWHYNDQEIDNSRKKLIQYIDQLVTAYDANPEAVYIGGFSQGAIMSLFVGMTAPEKIDGVYCMSGQLYPNFKDQIKTGPAFDELEIFITHGKKDNVLPYADIKKSALYLLNQGANVETKWYDAEHNVTQQNLSDLVYWISTQVDKHN